MEPMLSFCGYRCDLCLAYQPNISAHPENAQILSDGWFKYFGFRIPPEAILCPGCHSSASQTLDNDCPVRPCAIARDLENCALCEDAICEKLESRLVDFEVMQQKHGQPIPLADRQRFIFPYENVGRLAELREKSGRPKSSPSG